MTGFSTELFILGIICRIYVNTAMSTLQSAAPIVSGSPAELGQFPWNVIVVLESTEEDIDICGGSIITHSWVLTAAHCLTSHNTVVLIFGTIELSNEDISMNSSMFCIHPEFNGVTLENDIGLIKLPKPLEFNNNVKTIDLVPATEILNSFIGAPGVVCGYGRMEDAVSEVSEWLLWATVEIVNNSKCDEAFHEQTPITVICGEGWNGTNQSPCDGDSGGPLVWKNQAGKFVQIGIISYAEKDKCSQYPVGYTRVISYLDYINNIIRQ